MKLLFCYKDHEQSKPLRQSRNQLASLGWEMVDVHCRNHQQCTDALNGHTSDVVMVHQRLMEAVIDDGRPVVILERIDGAQLAEGRGWLEHENVRALIKGYALRPASLTNEYRGRVSAHLLKAAGVKSAKETMATPGVPKQLSPAALAKIRAGYGFASYSHLTPYAERSVNLDEPRWYNVYFAGTVAYSGSEIETHRRLAVVAARRCPNSLGSPGRSISSVSYMQGMLGSHVALSPWGCGEACHRDYEALLLGCVLVKPLTGHVECWPDIYQAGETYVPCALDFSDVTQVASEIVGNWADYREMRQRARQMVLDARQPAAVAKRIVDILEAVL